MNNSLNKENDQFLETIKSTIGKDIIETKTFFNDYQIIVPSKKLAPYPALNLIALKPILIFSSK